MRRRPAVPSARLHRAPDSMRFTQSPARQLTLHLLRLRVLRFQLSQPAELRIRSAGTSSLPRPRAAGESRFDCPRSAVATLITYHIYNSSAATSLAVWLYCGVAPMLYQSRTSSYTPPVY